MVKVVPWLVLFAVCGGAGPGSGQVAGADPAPPPGAADGAGVDAAEVEAVLTELDAGGVPATEEEIREFAVAADRSAGGGMLVARGGWARGQEADQGGRGRYSATWLAAKARWRRDREGRVEGAGTVVLGPTKLQLGLGQTGLSHGFGLLVGAPGRGRTLTADGGLGCGEERWVAWTGTPVAQALQGAGVQVAWGRWQSRVLVGHRPGAGEASAPTAVVQCGWQGDAGRLSGLFLSDPAERGGSLVGRVRQGDADGSWEAVWRVPQGSAQPLGALLVQLGWQLLPACRVELLAGWADPGPRPVMGQKGSVLGDWAGRGFACRGTWRVRRGLGIRLLVQRGRGRPVPFDRQRPLTLLTDLQATATWPGGWLGSLRRRTGGTEAWSWSERFPWQAPVFSGLEERTVTSLNLGREGVGQVLWRRLEQTRVRQGVGRDGGGTRSLLGLQGTTDLSRSLRLRGGWTVAWGDPVDLVSAVAPFAGLVVPRHWGRWRSERVVGLEGAWGSWQSRCAFSWRHPDAGEGEQDAAVWAAWAEVSLAW